MIRFLSLSIALGAQVILSSTFALASQKICAINQFSNKNCAQEVKDWIPYCSIDKMCFEGDNAANSKIWVTHQDGKKVSYNVTNWVDDIDWRYQRFSLLTLTSQDPKITLEGKLWLRYDAETQTSIITLLATTPDGFDFQTGKLANE